MNLLEVMKRFPDQETCIKHLEKIRWKDKPKCVHCESENITRKKEKGNGRIGRWLCNDCKASFKVTSGTLFHGMKIPLQKCFLAISLIVNAKKSLSSHQLGRDLDLNQKTAWFLMTRIRAEMVEDNILLQGIIEADETYIGGKPRKENKKKDRKKSKRGRGTNKDTIIGVVERGGKVVAKLTTELTGRTILDFIKKHVNMPESELMTDQFRGYKEAGKQMKHNVINHQEQYVDGNIHTNTIEGFWSLLKRAWYGQHHHYQTKYTPLYVAETAYKYNYRNIDCIWTKFVNESMVV